ncbi:MAG: acetoacetate--CoA ligase, partial [Myxococcales bacterium]
MSAPLWQPSAERIERAQVTAFARRLADEHGVSLPDQAALHRFSVQRPEPFWRAVFRDCGVLATQESPEVLADG